MRNIVAGRHRCNNQLTHLSGDACVGGYVCKCMDVNMFVLSNNLPRFGRFTRLYVNAHPHHVDHSEQPKQRFSFAPTAITTLHQGDLTIPHSEHVDPCFLLHVF